MIHLSDRTRGALTVVAAMAGSLTAVCVLASAPADGGDFDLRLDVRPGISGGVTLEAPPLGSLSADSFVGPVRLVIEVGDIRPDVAQATVSEALAGETPAVLERDPAEVFEAGVSRGLWRLAIAALVLGAAGGALGSFLLRRTGPSAVAGAAVGAATMVLLAGVAWATYDPGAYARPTVTGAFAARPSLGDPGAEGASADGTLSAPTAGSALGKLRRNLTGLYQGFLLPEETRAAREGATAVVVARADADPQLVSAVVRSAGAGTAVVLSGGPFVAASDLPAAVSDLPAAAPDLPPAASVAPGAAQLADRVIYYADLPRAVGAATFWVHPTGSVTLAGPGAMSLVVPVSREDVPARSDAPVVVMDEPGRVLVVYLDPGTGALRAYDLVERTGTSLEVGRTNTDGLR